MCNLTKTHKAPQHDTINNQNRQNPQSHSNSNHIKDGDMILCTRVLKERETYEAELCRLDWRTSQLESQEIDKAIREASFAGRRSLVFARELYSEYHCRFHLHGGMLIVFFFELSCQSQTCFRSILFLMCSRFICLIKMFVHPFQLIEF
jgi:hypothetical protein